MRRAIAHLRLPVSVAFLYEILQVLYGHFDDFRLLQAPAPLFHIVNGNQLAQVGKTVVHSVSPALLNDPMRSWVLLLHLLLLLLLTSSF